MNAAGNKRTPKEFPKDYYIKKTKENIGNNIFVSVIVNGKPVRELKGRLEYVTSNFFGVKIINGSESYIETFLFSEIFTGHIIFTLESELEEQSKKIETIE